MLAAPQMPSQLQQVVVGAILGGPVIGHLQQLAGHPVLHVLT